MELLLAIVGIALAVVALIAATRAWATSRRLAKEMLHQRDRLSRLEHQLEEQPARVEGGGWDHASAVASSLEVQLTGLEARLRDALERESRGLDAPVDDGTAPADQRERIIRHLRAQGYEHVSVLDVTEDGGVRVEAERAGVTVKGLARIQADGAIAVDAESSVRAFP